MAKDAKKESEWIERLINGGDVPCLDPENCPNGWASPPGDRFMVRGPDYLATKVKIPGGDYLLKPIGFDWIKGPAKISEVLKNPNSRIRRVIDDVFTDGNRPFIWAIHLQLPTKENHSVVAYFVSTEPAPEGSLMDQFLKGDDVYRNARLKMIANIVKGPWIVRKAVGERGVCLIGRAITCKYSVSEHFCEVHLDVGSSVVAKAIFHVALGYIKSVTVDLAFLVEGQTESELPEQIIGAFRFSELDPASAGTLEASDGATTGHLKPSMSERLWNSIGQSLKQIH
uniref:Protein ENHANCED DISEASE RESISTANCE 2 C-terminal domain-containing protein n=1 Tax=Kalanchoe fedtschenkoi TaxID=63787 RepID=A0A7N0VJC5_KALFE